jgi:hypothetical protein
MAERTRPDEADRQGIPGMRAAQAVAPIHLIATYSATLSASLLPIKARIPGSSRSGPIDILPDLFHEVVPPDLETLIFGAY